MTPNLIDHIIQATTRKDPNTFYFSSRKEFVKFFYSLIYKYFAMYIHMQARQDHFSTTQHGCNPLHDSFIQTQHHFQTLSPESSIDQTLFSLLYKKFLLYPELVPELSNSYQSIIKHLGY
jgi:hypothetical protein